MFFMKMRIYISAYLLNITNLRGGFFASFFFLILLHISFERLMIFYLNLIFEGTVYRAIRTTAVPCYLYIIISTAFEDLDLFPGKRFQNKNIPELGNLFQKFSAAWINIFCTEVHNGIMHGAKPLDLEKIENGRNGRDDKICLCIGLFCGISPSNKISERTCAVFTLNIPFLPHPYEISLQGKDYNIFKYPKIIISDG